MSRVLVTGGTGKDIDAMAALLQRTYRLMQFMPADAY